MPTRDDTENKLTKAAAKDGLDRRSLLAGGAALTLAGSLAACERAGEDKGEKAIGESAVEQCQRMLALDSIDDDERAQIVATLDDQLESIRAIRDVDFANTDAPAQVFDPRLPGSSYPAQSGGVTGAVTDAGELPSSEEDIAFAPVHRQAHWIRTKQISARELTQLYLDRIERYADLLKNYITVTADLAMEQAARADDELANGGARSPLHGIPYGLKDLVDTKGIRTSWGATPYKDRVAERDAWIVTALEEAGAVLLGKTTNGAIAYNDLWFGGVTRNPFHPGEGSSGSSAGSASATSAGMCAFSIGTETLGSIVSPSNRCGATGLRPTFGRVPRTGAMALCWSLDKIGPICRSAADTGLVLAAINGHDPHEPASIDHGFQWDAGESIAGMRVGFDPAWFEEANEVDQAALEAARGLGIELVEISVPQMPYGAMIPQLEAEAAAAFQELTLENIDDEMRWQADRAWPNTWRRIHFYSAVDLVQIDRLRRRVMARMAETMDGLDAMLGPNFAGGMLVATNYTGHPSLTLRAGFAERTLEQLTGRDEPQGESLGQAVDSGEQSSGQGSGNGGESEPEKHSLPRNVSLWAPLFEERNLLSLGAALESALDVAGERPPLERWLRKMNGA